MEKVWFITGASSGLGKSLAEAVLTQGGRVVITGRRERELQDISEQYPHQCLPIAFDMTDTQAMHAAVREAKRHFGRIDVVVSNAGEGLLGALEECTEEQIRRNIEVNFTAPTLLTKAVLPLLREQGSGHLIYTGAAAAIANYPGFSVYGGAKAATELLAESVALEIAPLGIFVTVVLPGPFRTGFVANSVEKATESLEAYAPTSGKFGMILSKMDGRQAGDPDRAAKAIIAATEAEKPPFRLVLGKYATDKVRKKSANILAELDVWESVGVPTDFPRGLV
jgi:NAD(P)-dependent dehydrogenase (short-subunit alcohol dehydrogenase family)